MAGNENIRSTVTRALAVTVVDTQDRTSDEGDPPARASSLPGVGDVVGGHYRLVRVLGEGMFGKVYVAQRIDVPEHQVALKMMLRSVYAGRNVERELVMLATVGHPHVVQLKDHGTTDDYVWLTMPVYDGETLFDRLKRGPLGLREAHDIFLSIAYALEALHNAGLRHQDIKPENIFLARFGERVHPILLDLGVAAECEAPFVAGTALYASPEQLLAFTGVPGAIPLTEKMDTYCFGATLLVALIGAEAFPGDGATSRDEVAQAHERRANAPLEGTLPDLVGEPRRLIEGAFKTWLALEPSDRPPMSKLTSEIDVLLEPEREAAREETRKRERQRRTLQRFRLAIGAMLVLGLAGLAIAYSKRETLRLAGELNAARNKSAESFDKLDTCIAAHNMSRSELMSCRAGRDKERADFRQELDEIGKSGNTSEAEHARQIQALSSNFGARVKACEDGAVAAEKAAVVAEKAAVAECNAARAAAIAERDEGRAIVESRAAEAKAFIAQRDQCVAERAVCIEQRDACVAAPGPKKPAPAAPAPGVATAQENTPVATATPAPPPPPPAPAPATAEPAAKPAAVPP